jgi:type IV pilus assembly protein PilX
MQKRAHSWAVSSPSSSQRGVSLVIVLLFLLAITGLSVWAARQSMLGEGMARNQVDLEVARQAAESALRDAERDLKNATPATLLTNASCARSSAIIPANFDENCKLGLCYRSDADYAAAQWITSTSSDTAVTPEPWWPQSKGGLWNNEFEDDQLTSKPGRTPISATNCTTFTGGVPLGTYTGAPAIYGVAIQPQYLIEYFKRSVPGRQEMAVYRITARGFGYTERTQVVLQTTFLPE